MRGSRAWGCRWLRQCHNPTSQARSDRHVRSMGSLGPAPSRPEASTARRLASGVPLLTPASAQQCRVNARRHPATPAHIETFAMRLWSVAIRDRPLPRRFHNLVCASARIRHAMPPGATPRASTVLRWMREDPIPYPRIARRPVVRRANAALRAPAPRTQCAPQPAAISAGARAGGSSSRAAPSTCRPSPSSLSFAMAPPATSAARRCHLGPRPPWRRRATRGNAQPAPGDSSAPTRPTPAALPLVVELMESSARVSVFRRDPVSQRRACAAELQQAVLRDNDALPTPPQPIPPVQRLDVTLTSA